MKIRYRKQGFTTATAYTFCGYGFLSILTLGLLLVAGPSRANPYRGLWVGQATMNYVNEVSIPLDEENVARASDPLVATPTADQANLRLILHVNSAGQASLLKQVAIVNLTPDDEEGVESDLSLISDESLYAEIPPQAATRIASASFDFGDSQTTRGLDAIMAEVIDVVTGQVVAAAESHFASDATRDALILSVASDAQDAGDSVIGSADATAAFDLFLQTYWNSDIANEIATNPASSDLSAAITQAALLESGSFYGDARANEMIEAVQVAVAAEITPEDKQQAAQFWTAAYADVENVYHRFLAGQVFGSMIVDGAEAAAEEAAVAGATEASVRAVVDSVGAVAAADAASLTARVAAYNDTRSVLALDQVLDAIVSNALATVGSVPFVEAEAQQAGWAERDHSVAHYPVPTQVPTTGYDLFVDSDGFLTSAEVAAEAAAEAAVEERRDNVLYTAGSIRAAAKVAAFVALQSVYASAARTVDTAIHLDGEFGNTNGVLTGTVYLPANHPTNPFRHRKHPDHTTGFDVTRELEFRFLSGSGNPTEPVGYGVEKVNGVFQEEIHGLHKPLGGDSDDPIGLIVVGAFELHRISLIDTLNTL